MLVCTTWKARPLSPEAALALGEFIDLASRPVHDLDSAMPAIMAAMERGNG